MRLDTKVVQPLMNYGIKCKQTKNDLKGAFSAQEREQAQKRKLEQIRQKSPGDRNKLSIAETDLQKASVEASRISKALQEQTDKFEIEKLRDLKVCFCLIWISNLLIHYKVSL
jgi:DNA helicase IV